MSTASSSITKLNTHDVLLGRGSGCNEYIGNIRWREYVKTRKQEYLFARNNAEKKRIAQQVIEYVSGNGGRFVEQKRKGRMEGDVLVGGIWVKATEDTVLEKVKQALRQKPKTKKSPEKSDLEAQTIPEVEESVDDQASNALPKALAPANIPEPNAVPALAPSSSQSQYPPPLAQDAPSATESLNRFVVSTLLGHLQAQQSVAFNARLLLFQGVESLLSDSTFSFANDMPTPSSTGFSRAMDMQDHFSNYPLASTRKHRLDNGLGHDNEIPLSSLQPECEGLTTPNQLSKDDEAAAFVLSTLAVDETRPTLPYEQFERERENLTSLERDKVLFDMFGKMHIREEQVLSKRIKSDFDEDSVAFLIQKMCSDIDKTPLHEKEALSIALTKCRREEFSRDRLELFLRCDEMNPELAAKRFIGYWEKRREVFGEEKFTMRMTLGEALRDDIVALKSGVYALLPYRDASGRQILFGMPSKHTRDGYTSESMFRAIWYLWEVAASLNTDEKCGVVDIGWLPGVSLFEYDPSVYDRLVAYATKYWPVRAMAHHACCPPIMTFRIVAQIISAVTDLFTRSRVQVHAIPETEIVGALREYGILPEMLPTIIPGGLLELNIEEWIAHRRAIEMEEIS